jgi:hypothetical protein
MFLTPKQLELNQKQIDEICERLWKKELESAQKNCHDCGVAPGERHLEGCDVARCTSCGGQRLGCDCKDGQPDVWTGVWPGIKECYEQKLICYDTCLYPSTNTEIGWSFDLNEWYDKVREK